jgi:hypothetical protein
VAGGCTDCGRKGGCDHRKRDMFAAVDEALARLYPGRCFGERADDAGLPPLASTVGPLLADRLGTRLGALALFRPGGSDEYCDFIYVLCLGRQPSLIELREGLSAADAPDAPMDETIEELYLRVALSSVAPFAAVQQVHMRGVPAGDGLLIEEALRPGVFDPVLLPRFRKLVAVLAEMEIRHLDFGEISEPPPGFDAGDYAERFGGAPAVANYLFYPQPCSSITTTLVPHRVS